MATKNFKMFEKKSLESMATLKELEGVSVAHRKKAVRAIWKHLNEKVAVKSRSEASSQSREAGGYQPGKGIETKDVAKTALKAWDTVNLLSKVIFPILL
jgi:hypothetical protein